jgi:hypothetical protein
MGFLSGLFRGGSDELGWDDLVRRAADAIAKLGRYAERGRIAFPPEVIVRIEVGGGSVDVVRGFVENPELDAKVGAVLMNEHDCAASDLPIREYVVSVAERTSVTATEGLPKVWTITIEGGDRSGSTFVVPSGRGEIRFGRGTFHGKNEHLRNELVVAETSDFVSRRAGRLMHAGPSLEVESLDQADNLSVRRASGEVLRPARTAKGRVAVRAGDVIELSDGTDKIVRLVVRRAEEDRGGDHA